MTVAELREVLAAIPDQNLEVWVGRVDRNRRFHIHPGNVVGTRTLGEDETYLTIEYDPEAK